MSDAVAGAGQTHAPEFSCRSPTTPIAIIDHTGGTALQFRVPTQARPTDDADLVTGLADPRIDIVNDDPGVDPASYL